VSPPWRSRGSGAGILGNRCEGNGEWEWEQEQEEDLIAGERKQRGAAAVMVQE